MLHGSIVHPFRGLVNPFLEKFLLAGFCTILVHQMPRSLRNDSMSPAAAARDT